MGRNRLENEGAQALATVFEKLQTLEEVVMPQNGIYHVGITALAKGLSVNPNLRVLNLNDNTIGLKGARALANVLPNFRGLEELNLGDCLLKSKGAKVLAETLSIHGNHTSLKTLDLSNNEIRADAGLTIAQSTHDKTLLTSLQLNGNCFGSAGKEKIEEVLVELGRNDTLSPLDEDYSEDEEEEEEGDDDDGNDDEEKTSECESSVNEDEESENENNMTKENNRAQCAVVTVPEFLASPIGEKLLLLQDNSVQAFVDYAMVTY